MSYNSRSRVFSYLLSPRKMEEYMKNKGYIVISISKIVRDYGYTCSELIKKLNLYQSTFNYKLAFKPEERDLVYRIFINTIELRSNYINNIGNYQDGGKWFWQHSNYTYSELLFNYILEERAMKVLRSDFEKLIRHERD